MMPKTTSTMTPKMIGQFRHASEKALKDIEEASYLLQSLSLEPTDIDVEPWLKEHVGQHPICSDSKVKIEWKIVPGFPKTLQMDKELFARAIKEILDNCVDALAGKGGVVTVSLTGAGSQAAIEIHNTGDPMSAEILESAVQPFFTNKQGRRGLGLSWARKIAMEHGGSLSISNEKKGGVSVILQVG